MSVLPKSSPQRMPPPERERVDGEVLRALVDGDPSALGILIERHGVGVTGYIRRLVRDRSWTDDLVQEVFVRVYERANTYDPRWSVRVWIFAIARNLAVDLMRREGLRRDHLGAIAQDRIEPATIATVESRELEQELEGAIAKLPEGFRSVLLLRDAEGLSYEEIGEVLGISAKTVSSRLHRSRVQIGRQMRRYFE